MSMLSLCLSEIKSSIPAELISEMCLASRYGKNPWSAVDEDAVLIAEVFERRLMPDLNVVVCPYSRNPSTRVYGREGI